MIIQYSDAAHDQHEDCQAPFYHRCRMRSTGRNLRIRLPQRKLEARSKSDAGHTGGLALAQRPRDGI